MDHLIGLKENVIIGKHIPAGTGMRKYRDVKLSTELELDDEIDLMKNWSLTKNWSLGKNKVYPRGTP